MSGPKKASRSSGPQTEQPAAQVFVCRVSAPASKTTVDAATQWKARPSSSPPACASVAPAPDASPADTPSRDANAAIEAANRSLANLERLVKEQHQQACSQLNKACGVLLEGKLPPHAASLTQLSFLQLVASGVLPPDAEGGITAGLWHPASFAMLSDEQKTLQREVDKLAALAASIAS